MPPAYLGHERLAGEDIDRIRHWIEQGAEWRQHWALTSPTRRTLPPVQNRTWPQNPIDFFVLMRLEQESLRPSPEAGPERLIRRLTLDLTGLPPSTEEIDEFLSDSSPQAYEKVVDRLLQSLRFGERMAARWLDVARYADTNGYQSDGERSMWRWRDWVIDAFNRNLPFDQFTVEQIAGDMLPGASRDQIIATGFNRNHRTSAEGGIIDEEFRVEYVADRVETTATVWLGLTVGCARCHDHKFDPITQKEYYKLFAYFNNVPERGFVYNFGNEKPLVKAPTPEQQARLDQLDRDLLQAEQRVTSLENDIRSKQATWEEWLANSETPDCSVDEGLLLHMPLDGDLSEQAGIYETSSAVYEEATENKKETRELIVEHPVVVGSDDPNLPFVPGRVRKAGRFDGSYFVDAGTVVPFGYQDPFSMGSWIYPTAADGAIITSVVDEHRGRGHGLYLRSGRLRFNFTKRWTDLGLRIETERPLELNRWHHVLMTYDGKREAEGCRLYVNGVSQPLRVLFNQHLWPTGEPLPFRIGAGEGPQDRFHGLIDEVRVYRRALSAEEAEVLSLIEPTTEIASMDPFDRTTSQANKLRFCFLERYAPRKVQEARRSLARLRGERESFLDAIPSVMVMKESETPRETFVLKRGRYDSPGLRVSPGVPEVMPALGRSEQNDRLGFARWLVDSSNPLTARVTVNRFWQMLFGVGLVKTTEDFGSQGDRPHHPELLDWLALEFVDSGWDIKALLKKIVTSATYRQSSRLTPELLEKDPENRLLARGPRFRLSAGVIRDQALAVSGLLLERIGGPSVKPYQPPGLWQELAFSKTRYQTDKGANRYRRSLYTYWKRTIPPPAMMTLDASHRETCSVRPERTNTPLQALNLMNDRTYVESSYKLALRMIESGGSTPEQRIAHGFRLVTSRVPEDEETGVLRDLFDRLRVNNEENPEAARLFLEDAGAPTESNLVDLASYTGVASAILNLDETITKE